MTPGAEQEKPKCPSRRLPSSRPPLNAREYRQANGTGGWIFAPDDNSLVVLFPPHVTPSAIFNHKLTRGLSGSLISNA